MTRHAAPMQPVDSRAAPWRWHWVPFPPAAPTPTLPARSAAADQSSWVAAGWPQPAAGTVPGLYPDAHCMGVFLPPALLMPRLTGLLLPRATRVAAPPARPPRRAPAGRRRDHTVP